MVKDGKIRDPEKVSRAFKEILFLRNQTMATRGWLIEILKCLDSIKESEFTLEKMYSFEHRLKQIFPHNNHIKDKIRQQLQILRDKGIIEFIGRGKYRKL